MTQPEQLLLSNEVPVILQDYPGAVAATYWWVSTGSADESPPEAGFAHFLEHMLFKDAAAKDTGKASTGQTALAIESLGGDINAYTSFDQTVYHVTCAEQHWERVLDQFGPMAKSQRFLKSDFEREREVILEELRKNNDSPGRMLFQELFELNFGRHPYGRPVIGFEKILKSAKLPALEKFYRSNYAASKMGVILVGPLGPECSPRRRAILSRAEKYFGKRAIPFTGKPHAAPQKPSTYKEASKNIETRVVSFDVKSPTVALAFRAPALSHPDTPALDILAGVLGQGEMSRLHQRLFYKESLVIDASGGLFPQKEAGMLYFQIEAEDLTKAEKAYGILLEELARMRDVGPTPAELTRILVNSESEKLYSTQTADGVAGRLGFLKFVVGDLTYDREYLDRMREADASAIREAATKYFSPTRMSLVVLVPEKTPKPDLKGWATKAMEVLQVPKAPARPSTAKRDSDQPEIMRLPSGARLVYRYRPQSNVASIHAGVLGGLRLELSDPVTTKDRDWGAGHLMAMTWNKGARTLDGKTLDSQAISGIIEGSAASLEGFSGRNTAGLQLTCLARDWRRLADLFGASLFSPTFDDAEVAHARRISEDAIRSIEDHTSQLCSKLFLETLFEQHPYGRLTTGSLESVASIDGARLSEFHRRWLRPDRLVISVSGNVKRSELDAWSREFDAQVIGLKNGGVPGPGPAPESPLTSPRWVERSLGREQSHILVGGLGLAMNSKERWALLVLNNLLSGQSGLLFIELREKKSLAYSVSPLSFEGIEPGYVGTYIACAPSKKDEALAGIRAVHEAVAAKGVSEKALARAREFHLGRRAMDLQSDSTIAAHHGLEEVYGMEHLSEKEIVSKVRSVTVAQVKDVCRRFLVDAPAVTSVVG